MDTRDREFIKIPPFQQKALFRFTSILFVVWVVVYFCPIPIFYKISFPLATLFLSSLFLLPRSMCLAMLFSALGDLAGAFGSLPAQIFFFALAHVALMTFFLSRQSDRKKAHDKSWDLKTKMYRTLGILFAITVMIFSLYEIIPATPKNVIRIGVAIYTVLIATMLFTAFLQKDSFFAIGALLFVLSDIILSLHLFVKPVSYGTFLIMIPYYTGQWLLFMRSAAVTGTTQDDSK